MTTAYNRIAAMDADLRILQGGTSASKTFSIMQYLASLTEQRHDKLYTVVSDDLPALKKGPMRDLKRILNETHHNRYFDVNKSDNIWTCRSTGSQIEFFGVKDEIDARGPRRDGLFVNEGNRISFATFEQLYARTSGPTWIDFNPSARFWVHDIAEGKLPEFKGSAQLEILTYRDNEELDEKTRRYIEGHDRESNWWRVYGDGLIGELEGNVFSGWTFLSELPVERNLIGYGLDFGFRPDPCALVALWQVDDALILEQVGIESGLDPSQIVEWVRDRVEPGYPIICDNARPEIINQMQTSGMQAMACIKQEKVNGEWVRKQGQLEKMQEIKFLAIGKDLEQEYLTYAFKQSRDGRFESKIPDGNDHLLDASRYIWYWFAWNDKMSQDVANSLREYR